MWINKSKIVWIIGAMCVTAVGARAFAVCDHNCKHLQMWMSTAVCAGNYPDNCTTNGFGWPEVDDGIDAYGCKSPPGAQITDVKIYDCTLQSCQQDCPGPGKREASPTMQLNCSQIGTNYSKYCDVDGY